MRAQGAGKLAGSRTSQVSVPQDRLSSGQLNGPRATQLSTARADHLAMVATQVGAAGHPRTAQGNAQAKKNRPMRKKRLTRGRSYATVVAMVGYDIGLDDGDGRRTLTDHGSNHIGGNMSKFGFKKSEENKEEEQNVSVGEPQAYVFLGRDKYRADEQEHGAQGWRKLFLTLSRMAAEGTQGKVTQNTFGLEILYTGLLEVLETAKEELGDEFTSEFDKTWNKILDEETNKNARKAARQAADKAAEQAREAAGETGEEDSEPNTEEEVKEEPKPTTKPATPAKK